MKRILCFVMFFMANAYALPAGFVYLKDVAPEVQEFVSYYSEQNFTGKRVEGYKKPLIILTKEAALALKNVSMDLEKDGFSLVVYDGYRPQKSVDNFLEWGQSTEISQKRLYYPYFTKQEIFEKGFVSGKSSHSRGSTVDLTIIKKGNKICKIKEESRGELIYLNDCTEDMGMHFDFFGEESWVQSPLVSHEANQKRAYLKKIMEKNGFEGIPNEWWHFTLKDEPFKDTYFDFDVE